MTKVSNICQEDFDEHCCFLVETFWEDISQNCVKVGFSLKFYKGLIHFFIAKIVLFIWEFLLHLLSFRFLFIFDIYFDSNPIFEILVISIVVLDKFINIFKQCTHFFSHLLWLPIIFLFLLIKEWLKCRKRIHFLFLVYITRVNLTILKHGDISGSCHVSFNDPVILHSVDVMWFSNSKLRKLSTNFNSGAFNMLVSLPWFNQFSLDLQWCCQNLLFKNELYILSMVWYFILLFI